MTDYKNPPLTVDAIIEQDGSILMIRRKGEAFNGYLAFPGGFIDYGETVENAVKREVLEELNLQVDLIAILGVYSDKKRDPRGHVISTIFICNSSGTPKASDDASDFEWIHLDIIESLELAFDHKKIIKDYKIWKIEKGTYWSSKD